MNGWSNPASVRPLTTRNPTEVLVLVEGGKVAVPLAAEHESRAVVPHIHVVGFSETHAKHRAIAKKFDWRRNRALEPEGPFLFSASTRELSRASHAAQAAVLDLVFALETNCSGPE